MLPSILLSIHFATWRTDGIYSSHCRGQDVKHDDDITSVPLSLVEAGDGEHAR
jgi:hypothetical protein